MCRFVAYLGREDIVLRKLLEDPDNSLITQSLNAKQGVHGVNADGFGISWYNRSVDDEPGLFRSTRPAWNDYNLISMARKIESNCMLGHIRSATMGEITTYNCHPFVYKEYSFVHNGGIAHFEDLRRELISELDEELFQAVRGQTDSEHLFFLIMQFLKQEKQMSLEQALLKGIQWVNDRQKDTDNEYFCGLNIAITDGKQLIVTRYCSKDRRPISLYYTTSKFKDLMKSEVVSDNLIVASEPLTNMSEDWTEIPLNHYIIFDLDKGMEIKGLSS